MNFKTTILLLAFTGYLFTGIAQNQNFGIWTGLKVSKAYHKKIKVFGEVQSRFNQNASQFRSLYFQAGVSYKFAKWYNLGVVYRHTNYVEVSSNRFDIDNVFKHKINDNSFEIRLKYQKTLVTNEIKGNRFRIRFKYAFKVNKKFKPYLKAQYFYSKVYDYSNWNQQRYTVGAVVRVAKKNYVDVFYNYEFEQNVVNPTTQYILGLKYKLVYK